MTEIAGGLFAAAFLVLLLAGLWAAFVVVKESIRGAVKGARRGRVELESKAPVSFVRDREAARRRAAAGLPAPPRIARTRSDKGIYAIKWLHGCDCHPTPGWWKIGMGSIDRRIGAHTSAVWHRRVVVARLPCDHYEQWERTILGDLAPWKRNERLVPGEELFDATPQVDAYLRELFVASGGTWEEKR